MSEHVKLKNDHSRLRRVDRNKWGDEAEHLERNIFRCPVCGVLCGGANSLSDHVHFCRKNNSKPPHGHTGQVH